MAERPSALVGATAVVPDLRLGGHAANRLVDDRFQLLLSYLL